MVILACKSAALPERGPVQLVRLQASLVPVPTRTSKPANMLTCGRRPAGGLCNLCQSAAKQSTLAAQHVGGWVLKAQTPAAAWLKVSKQRSNIVLSCAAVAFSVLILE